MFVYRKSVLTKLVGNILDPTVFSKTGEICTSVRNGTKAHFMCFLLIYQGEFLSSDTLNLKCIVCDREKKLCAKIYLSIARWNLNITLFFVSFLINFCLQFQGLTNNNDSFVPFPLLHGRISSVGRALDCRAGGRGFDSRGRTNTQGLKITEK